MFVCLRLRCTYRRIIINAYIYERYGLTFAGYALDYSRGNRLYSRRFQPPVQTNDDHLRAPADKILFENRYVSGVLCVPCKFSLSVYLPKTFVHLFRTRHRPV